MQPVVWVRCETTAHLDAIGDLAARLRSDGDDVLFLVTVRGGPDGHTPHPRGAREVRAFIAQHRPLLTLMVDGVIDTNVLAACDAAKITVVTINGRPDTLREMTGGWFRAGAKPPLADIVAAFSEDTKSIETLQKLGVPPGNCFHVGPWEPGATVLPVHEDSRQKMADLLHRRPIWMARGVRPDDMAHLIEAQNLATRQSHRLLLCVSPAIPMEGIDLADAAKAAGLHAGLRSMGEMPHDTTQVYVADLDGEDGLWLRLASACFAAGTLSRGAAHDPFEAAALGAVVVHGSNTDPFAERFQRLATAGASLHLQGPDDLGPAITTLLPPDRVAEMALAGWQAMSSGAEISDKIVALIQDRLDLVSA